MESIAYFLGGALVASIPALLAFILVDIRKLKGDVEEIRRELAARSPKAS